MSLLLGLALLALAGCGGSGGGGAKSAGAGNGNASGVGNSPATLVSIQITPATKSIAKGTTAQFAATGTYDDNTTQDLTATVTWTSAATDVATIASAGLATGVASGTANITATFGTVTSNTASLAVTAATLVSLQVTPATKSIAKSTTQQFAATGAFSDNTTQNLTATVTWTSATTGVATINAAGLATGVTAGSSIITATSGAVTSNTATLTVTAATLVSIQVTAASTSIAKGTTQQYTATGTYTDGIKDVTASVLWAEDSGGTVATIGAHGLATAVATGTSHITATFSGVTSNTASLTVTAAPLVSIQVAPASMSIGQGDIQQFIATGTFGDSSTQDLTLQASWSSDTTSVATITSGQGGGNGSATGVAVGGPVNITATLGGKSGTAQLTVTVALANAWTWVGGSSTAGATGVYGTLGTAAAGNVPAGRRRPASLKDSSGNFWLFGGYTAGGYMNDLWKFDGVNWTWMSGSNTAGAVGVYGSLGTPAAGNVPGAREGAAAWGDSSGNLWLFGGTNGSNAYYNDLWKYTPGAGTWTWVWGSNSTNATTVYGSSGQAAVSNVPGARYTAAAWGDSSGNLWMFGGYGWPEASFPALRSLGDLWKYNPGTGMWTWFVGTAATYYGTFGSLGTAAAANVPPARANAATWIDGSDNLWFFGGNSTIGYFADLWKYNPITTYWTWMPGSNPQSGTYPSYSIGPYPNYGTQTVAASSNVPGLRYGSGYWADGSGNLWMFGGYGDLNNGLSYFFNDLWNYNPASTWWTWMSGNDNTHLPQGSYGTLGKAAANNLPPPRVFPSTWIDGKGRLWLFGGGSCPSYCLNDLWRYQP